MYRILSVLCIPSSLFLRIIQKDNGIKFNMHYFCIHFCCNVFKTLKGSDARTDMTVIRFLFFFVFFLFFFFSLHIDRLIIQLKNIHKARVNTVFF
jgi:hypothetical protein